jgi:hypothetical protein
VAASLIFMPLVYLSLGSNSSIVFGWFANITTIAGLIGWLVIEVTYLTSFYALKTQGISKDRDFKPTRSFVLNEANRYQDLHTKARSNPIWLESLQERSFLSYYFQDTASSFQVVGL